jgi:hypothetical protein
VSGKVPGEAEKWDYLPAIRRSLVPSGKAGPTSRSARAKPMYRFPHAATSQH